MTTELKHYGTPRHSGRYPWGSGDHPYERSASFLGRIKALKDQGLSDVEIAKGMGLKNTSELRKQKTIARLQKQAADASFALRLSDKGMSKAAIAERMGISDHTVAALLDPAERERADITRKIADSLKSRVDEAKYIDIGEGVENQLGISKTKLNTAVAMLEKEGYTVHNDIYVMQPGTGKYTIMKVLTSEDTPYAEVVKNSADIKLPMVYSVDGGRTMFGIETPQSVDSNRISVRYADDVPSGADADGLIELRRGVDDLSLGNARYAQVRIEVGGTHYMKGMAIYSDDLPDGKDIIYNTNKTHADAAKVFKSLKADPENLGEVDPDNPFGAVIRQRHYTDQNGEDHLSSINIVGTAATANEEGAWAKYSKNLSSQVLSKQSPALAKQQLGLAYNLKKEEFDETLKLTNPAVQKRLLDSFADDCDSSAEELKGAALPGQAWHVLLPFSSIKENEVFAPQYQNGDTVVLIRHPHGGTFEIPELTVNNKNQEAISHIGKDAEDAVGINPKVAIKLSGADFDGDDVIVIPNDNGQIRTSASIKSLEDFDPRTAYKGFEGMPKMTDSQKQMEMGKISNLITDMTIKGASNDEIARAVKHSMVVIDAQNHDLNYKQSFIDNNIADLKRLYQGGEEKGAATLISRAKSMEVVPERKDRGTTTTPARINPKTGEVYGNTNPVTGEKVYRYTGKEPYKVHTGEYTIDSKTGKRVYLTDKMKTITPIIKSTKMAERTNALELSSGTKMENIYGDFANKMKDLANQARVASLNVIYKAYSPAAKETYASEVESLLSKLDLAYRNKPLERQSLLLANKVISSKRQNNPKMTPQELKRVRGQALAEARRRINPDRQKITITDKEWEAIQTGALSKNRLSQLLLNTDIKSLKERAMPRTPKGMLPARISRARDMIMNGYTRSEVAKALGVSINTLNVALT